MAKKRKVKITKKLFTEILTGMFEQSFSFITTAIGGYIENHGHTRADTPETHILFAMRAQYIDTVLDETFFDAVRGFCVAIAPGCDQDFYGLDVETYVDFGKELRAAATASDLATLVENDDDEASLFQETALALCEKHVPLIAAELWMIMTEEEES